MVGARPELHGSPRGASVRRRVLGINAFRRDPAAALVVDGQPIAAVQEERLTRKSGEEDFPSRSVRWCLEAAGCTAQELDLVVVAEKPLRRFERKLASQLDAFPKGAGPFARFMFLWLGDRLWMRGRIAAELEIPAEKVRFVEHARAHIASAAAYAGQARVTALVLDDVGEWATQSLAVVDGASIEMIGEQRYPHSLGLVASALTQHLGLTPGVDEVALDLLASAGETPQGDVLAQLVRVEADGALMVDPDAFPFAQSGDALFGEPLERALGPRREAGRTPSFADEDATAVAAIGLKRLGDCAVAMANHGFAKAPSETLVAAGILARMPRLVERLRVDGPFPNVVVPPWPDEAGTALGAALVGADSTARNVPPWLGPDLGPALGEGAPHSGSEAAMIAAQRLAKGELIGWAAGPLAFGETSLGGRIAVADARLGTSRARLLSALQRPEDWQSTWLALVEPPVGDVQDFAQVAEDASARCGARAVTLPRSLAAEFPAACAPDGSARLLIPGPEDPSGLGALLREAAKLGLAGLLVTELRTRGGVLPRVELEAVETFRRSGLDALVTANSLYGHSGTHLAPKASTSSLCHD